MNRTAIPSAAVAETGAYRFAEVTCYDLRLTKTGRLTEPMLDAVFTRARIVIESSAETSADPVGR